MQEIVFKSQLVEDGHLYCPKEYVNPKAQFKVIVTLPDEEAVDSPRAQRPFGLCKGEFRVPDDFDAPLPEYIIKEFERKRDKPIKNRKSVKSVHGACNHANVQQKKEKVPGKKNLPGRFRFIFDSDC